MQQALVIFYFVMMGLLGGFIVAGIAITIIETFVTITVDAYEKHEKKIKQKAKGNGNIQIGIVNNEDEDED